MALNYDDDSKVVVDTQHQLNVFQLWVDRGMLSIIFFFLGINVILSMVWIQTWYLHNQSLNNYIFSFSITFKLLKSFGYKNLR